MTILAVLIFAAATDANGICKTNAADVNGPTVTINYQGEFKGNDVQSFMYFIPLISISNVSSVVSDKNQQKIGITSYNKESDGQTFSAVCEFKMEGTGYNKYIFEPEGMIATHLDTVKDGGTLTEMLDWIKFEGDGLGKVEVEGEIKGGKEIVTKVDLYFAAGEQKSPVTVEIYSIDPVNGKYDYARRYDKIVARVQSLSFKRGEKVPRMSMKVASIGNGDEEEDFWSSVKAMVVNIFIPPTKIAVVGNETMLQFGGALYKKQARFTFPHAQMLK